jgi:pyrroloquinoline quinone biosynthesis protein E
MCRVWALAARDGEELSAGRYREMARVLAAAGLHAVTLGGEPLLRPDLPEVVAAFAGQGLAVRLQTNGGRLDAGALDALLRAGLGGISVALHHADAAEMDWLSGAAGAWRDALRAMDVVAAGTRSRRGFLRIANLVLYRGNLRAVDRVLALCVPRGFRLSACPVHRSPARAAEAQFARELDDRVRVRPEDGPAVREAVAALLRARRRRQGLDSTQYIRMIPAFFDGDRPPWPCLAGTLYAFVDHAGRIAPCHELDPVGSVFDPEVVASWGRGDLGGTSRGRRASCPGCLLPCWTELSLLFSSPRALLQGLEVNLPALRPGRP